ncbi:DUF1642 domain-containing protein [Lactococcus lactis]|uniref:DUF1642 domain-containing protein n=1 Tax=Lactococcus lactis TaxID=1358 RepID=UPI0028903FC9|nr:DUF1642 domain-containing protein [Lactococcus lactis]MDT2901548.1 DUF1642 domain-containing protein [Lactococcus lactis]
MTKFEEELMATAKMIPTSDGNEIKFKPYSALYDYLLVSNGEAELYLQQQALPVVPEDVDKAIKYLKTQNNFATFADFDDILTEKGLRWLNDFQFKDRRFGFGGLNNKLFILSHLAVTGYRVEKPKLFYLKAKELLVVGDYDHVEDLWLDWNKNFTPKKQDAHKFTQQEIDSMQTGSYEQIEVTE